MQDTKDLREFICDIGRSRQARQWLATIIAAIES